MTLPNLLTGWVVQLDPVDGPNATNYLPNPSFSYDTVGSTPGTWGTTNLLTAGATLSVVNSVAAIGAQAMKVVTGASASEGASILLNAPAGGYTNGFSYTFSIYIQGNAGGEHITLQLGTNSNNVTSAITATTSFVQYSVNWTPSPTATTGVYALVKGTNATAITFFADAGMVTNTSIGLQYFDGDTTMAPASSYSWAGAPGASNSTRVNTRTTVDINNPNSGIQIGGTASGQGPDWGTSQITEYTAQQSQYGSTVADYVWPNRTISIPIVLGTGQSNNPVDPNVALQSLREKVALFQREGGWLKRQRSNGANLYADVVDAQLQVPDLWGESSGYEPGVTLTLLTLPDFYGDEVACDITSATGVYTGLVTQHNLNATIAGDHPTRCPVVVKDTSGNNQLSLIWGVRAKHYDPATTAGLFYEAEALTPINGASTITLTGSSGGSAVAITGLPTATWVTMLSTTIAATSGNFTHQGSYRAWARCYSNTGVPQFQLLWGIGSLSVPVTNASTAIPAVSGFYLLDLGEVRLDPPPVGTNQWEGVIQAYSTASDMAAVDCIYFQPLDEAAGQLTYVYEAPASSIAVTVAGTTGVNDASSGTVAWSNPSNALAHDNADAVVILNTGSGTTSEWLKLTGFGLSIPTGATIKGIQVLRYGGITIPTNVRLVKTGTVQSGVPTIGYQDLSPPYDTWGNSTYSWGGTTDLWNTTWAPSDVNSTGFGCAIQFVEGAISISPIVDFVTITVFYALSSGFLVSSDAVVYANQNVHLRHDSMWRQAPSGQVYGPVSNVSGDLMRLPPSGVENRNVELFIKPSRGDLNSLPDSGLDGFTVQARYQPTYIFRP